jgi:hypothetical protein
MVYRAPFRLWTAEDSNSDDLENETNALLEPTTPEDQELKRVFLENASEEYKCFALAPVAMLARRMYHILRTGIFGDWSMIEAEAIISEWDKMHPEDGAALVDDESDDCSETSDGSSESSSETGR